MGTIKIADGEIVIKYDDKKPSLATVFSTLARCDCPEQNGATDAIESIILSHHCAGIDVASDAYVSGIMNSIEAVNNHLCS
jgi:hypothetical protein